MPVFQDIKKGGIRKKSSRLKFIFDMLFVYTKVLCEQVCSFERLVLSSKWAKNPNFRNNVEIKTVYPTEKVMIQDLKRITFLKM